ncbi:MAG: hypothetical protein IJN04_05365 [Clostridia bacterium]|nr:hypothetical protein [Clostridia bacterium]
MAYFYKDNPALEAQVDRYFARLAEFNDAHCDGKLSVLLLGSLSRGEGTWQPTDTGARLLSDIEYFTVYPDGFEGFEAFTDFAKEAQREIFADPSSPLFHVDNTFVRRESLPRMERKLLTYDAARMGKTVVGEDCVSLLPAITVENINLCDIRDILTHRVFSVLYYGLPMKREGDVEGYRYSLAKNSLDLMTVLLVSYGVLESGFMHRLELIKTLPIDERTKAYFAYCLSIKLSTVCDMTFSIEEMEEQFLSLLKELSRSFRVPLKNLWLNRRVVLRRRMGMIKRALRYRHLPRCGHLKSLIVSFEKKFPLTYRQLNNNLIINGYPT